MAGAGLSAHLGGRDNVIVLAHLRQGAGLRRRTAVRAPRVVRDFLVNRARGLIFSTAPSPLVAAAVREAIRMLADEPDRRDALHDLVAPR
jgi:8-amino-7-oxononanoate synthase